MFTHTTWRVALPIVFLVVAAPIVEAQEPKNLVGIELGGDVTTARANPLPGKHVATADSRSLFSVSIEREGHRFTKNDGPGVWRPENLRLGSTRARLKRCTSKAKGLLIGAAIGAAAGGLFTTYINRRLGYSTTGTGFFHFAAGGAGVGALVGLGHCS